MRFFGAYKIASAGCEGNEWFDSPLERGGAKRRGVFILTPEKNIPYEPFARQSTAAAKALYRQ
jgi:hypothetical protein